MYPLINKYLLILLLIIIPSCLSHIDYALPSHPKKIEHILKSRTYYLRCTAEFGPFFALKNKKMLVCRDFRRVRYMKDPFGHWISPGESEGLVSIGTPFKVTKVEFPYQSTVEHRPLLSPRYYTWIYVKDSLNREYIVILRGSKEQDDAFIKEFYSTFTADDPSPVFEKLSPTIRSIIKRRKVVIGMLEDALYMSQGLPDSIEISDLAQGHVMKILNYGYRIITLYDGVVKDVRDLP